MEKITLVCQNCGGQLDIDSSKTVLSCPYCGHSSLLVESDTIKSDKIRYETKRDIEIARIQENAKRDIEIERLKQKAQLKSERIRAKAEKEESSGTGCCLFSILRILIILCAICCLISLIYSFANIISIFA